MIMFLKALMVDSLTPYKVFHGTKCGLIEEESLPLRVAIILLQLENSLTRILIMTID